MDVHPAALGVFEERGYERASIDEVRARSGASVGSIYHHFGGGKEGIAAELYAEVLAGYQEGLLTALAAAGGARDGVEGVVGHHVEWIAANPARARYLFAGRPVASERLAEQNRAFFAAVTGWIEPHREAGALRAAPFDLTYALWLGPAQEWARLWLAGRDATEPAHAAGPLAAAAWAALREERG